MYDVAQPYDIVQMRFVPQGAVGSVVAVDAVDAGSIRTAPGETIELAYALSNVRTPLIIGAAHTHYGRNPLGLVLLAGTLALLVVAALWGGFWLLKRTARRRAPSPS
jgi:hypothetical protein